MEFVPKGFASETVKTEPPNSDFGLMQSDYGLSPVFPAGAAFGNYSTTDLSARITQRPVKQEMQYHHGARLMSCEYAAQSAFIKGDFVPRKAVKSEHQTMGAGSCRYSPARNDFSPVVNIKQESDSQLTSCDRKVMLRSYAAIGNENGYISSAVQNSGANCHANRVIERESNTPSYETLQNFTDRNVMKSEYVESEGSALSAPPNLGVSKPGLVESNEDSEYWSSCPADIQLSALNHDKIVTSQPREANYSNTDFKMHGVFQNNSTEKNSVGLKDGSRVRKRRKVTTSSDEENMEQPITTNSRHSIACQSVEEDNTNEQARSGDVDERVRTILDTILNMSRRLRTSEDGVVLHQASTDTSKKVSDFCDERNERYITGKNVSSSQPGGRNNTHYWWRQNCLTIVNGPEYLTHLSPNEYQELEKLSSQADREASETVFRVRCETCSSAFPHLDSLLKHMYQNHRTTADKPFWCMVCDRAVESKLHFIISKHERSGPDNERGWWGCPVCGLSFENSGKMYRHRKRVHIGDYGCKTCGMRFETVRSVKDHILKSEDHVPENKCPHCAIICRRDLFHKHVDYHMKGFPYTCDVCGYGTSALNGLAKHKLTHTAVRDKPCPHCDKCFLNDEGVKAHIISLHTKKTFICEVCGHAFAFIKDLRNHSHVHGEKKFTCSKCGKRFRSKMGLRSHIQKHHKPPEYRCHVCGKGLANKAELQSHMRVHNNDMPFECPFCERKFKRKHNMQSHLRTHGEDRKFKCEVCGDGFKWKHNLQNHMKTHAGYTLG